MVASPADCGVISPVVSFIVATPGSNEDHVPPESPLDVNVVVPLEQIASVPLKVPAFGSAVIVTTRVAVALGQASSSSPNTV